MRVPRSWVLRSSPPRVLPPTFFYSPFTNKPHTTATSALHEPLQPGIPEQSETTGGEPSGLQGKATTSSSPAPPPPAAGKRLRKPTTKADQLSGQTSPQQPKKKKGKSKKPSGALLGPLRPERPLTLHRQKSTSRRSSLRTRTMKTSSHRRLQRARPRSRQRRTRARSRPLGTTMRWRMTPRPVPKASPLPTRVCLHRHEVASLLTCHHFQNSICVPAPLPLHRRSVALVLGPLKIPPYHPSPLNTPMDVG